MRHAKYLQLAIKGLIFSAILAGTLMVSPASAKDRLRESEIATLQRELNFNEAELLQVDLSDLDEQAKAKEMSRISAENARIKRRLERLLSLPVEKRKPRRAQGRGEAPLTQVQAAPNRVPAARQSKSVLIYRAW